MSLQTWSETLITAQADGAALASSTTATSILPTGAKFTLPANWAQIGRKLRILASGRISTTTGPPTITFDVRFGGSIVVFNGAAVTTVASVTNKTWDLTIEMTVRSIGGGTSSTILGTGRLTSSALVGASGGAASAVLLPDSAPVVGSGFDSTTSQTVDLFATWSASSASNSVQLHQFDLIAAN